MNHRFERFARLVANGVGSPYAFCLALAIVLGWGASGPLFGFSGDWQLIINTGTTIVTFLMVFLIQSSQNSDTRDIKRMLADQQRAIPGADDALADEIERDVKSDRESP